jgi:hypothetical protein
MRSPPRVSLTLCSSAFCGWLSQTSHPYVTVLSRGTSADWTKAIVSVPFTSGIPCASRSTSFANVLSHIGFRSGYWSR